MSNFSVEYAMALGAVATGSIKAQLALIAAGIINNLGSTPTAMPAAARIGISSVDVAVLEVISVKKVTNKQIPSTNRRTGSVESPVNHVPIRTLKPDDINALAIQMPPANNNNMPHGISFAVFQSSSLSLFPFSSTSPLSFPLLVKNIAATPATAIVLSLIVLMPIQAVQKGLKIQAKATVPKIARTRFSAFVHVPGTGKSMFPTCLIPRANHKAIIGTPKITIGTPPNIIFMSVYEETLGIEYSFIDWMKTGVPIVILGVPIMALWLARGIKEVGNINLPVPGTWTKAEKRVLAIFGTVALAWIFRPFWTAWIGVSTISDSTIAVAGVAAMFLTNSGNDNGEVDDKGNNDKLLDWKTANDIPWGMLLLFAGGICIAKAFMSSGLSVLMGSWLTGLSTLPVLLLVLAICLFVTFLTEITSNTATSTLLMPILAAAGMAVGVDPKLLMIPAAISASCAFMLPVATAPNAIAYSTEKFDIKTMAREGVVLNVLVALVVTGVCYVTLA